MVAQGLRVYTAAHAAKCATKVASDAEFRHAPHLLKPVARPPISATPHTDSKQHTDKSLPIIAIMRFLSSAIAAASLLSSLVSATALTYKLAANEKACFFEDISKENSKVAFYFAVS